MFDKVKGISTKKWRIPQGHKDQPCISHCAGDPSHAAPQKLDPPKIPHKVGSRIQWWESETQSLKEIENKKQAFSIKDEQANPITLLQ